MRNLILSIVLIIIYIIGSFYLYTMIEETSKDLSNDLDLIQILIKEERWNEAEELYNKFKQEWNSISTLWMTFIGHEEIDNIEEAIKESDIYFFVREQAPALENLSKLNYYLKHIYLKEKIRWYNIF